MPRASRQHGARTQPPGLEIAFQRLSCRPGSGPALIFNLECDGTSYEAAALIGPGAQPMFPRNLYRSGATFGATVDAEIRAAAAAKQADAVVA